MPHDTQVGADHKIWIAQILCPSRHCILALPFDAAVMSPNQAMAALITKVECLVTMSQIDPWCGLCHSRDWRAEAGPTRFTTMEEARPELERLRAENAAAKRFYSRLRGKA